MKHPPNAVDYAPGRGPMCAPERHPGPIPPDGLFGLPENVTAAIMYAVPAAGLLVALVHVGPRSKFHAIQSLALQLSGWVLMSFAGWVPGGRWDLSMIVFRAGVVLWLVMIVAALMGRRLKLPFLGTLAERLAAHLGAGAEAGGPTLWPRFPGSHLDLPESRDTWQKLCAEIPGRIVRGGGFLGGFSYSLELPYRHWTITVHDWQTGSDPQSAFDVSQPLTALRARYVALDGFFFAIRGSNSVERWLGVKGIRGFDPVFDAEFDVKGNDESKVRAVWGDPRLREMVRAGLVWEIGIGPTRRGAGELLLRASRAQEVERLRALYQLVGALLDRLRELGSASDAAPR